MGIVSAMMQVGAAIKHAVAALFRVTHSLRFENPDADFLTQSNQATATDSDKWTLSVWIKVASNGVTNNNSTIRPIISGGENNCPLFLDADDRLAFYEYNGSSVLFEVYTTETIKVADGWTHVVMSVDYAANVTLTDKVKIWIDGTLASLTTKSNTLGSGAWNVHNNYASAMNGTTHTQAGSNPSRYIGKKTTALGRYFSGQMSEFHFIDGQALDASYFGETRSGQWVPKEVTGVTYGNNGFYLPFSTPSSTTNAFNAVTYTGDGASSRNITGVGFDPGLVWVKNRDDTKSHQVMDVVRGSQAALYTNATSGESNPQDSSNGGLHSLITDGFSVVQGTSGTLSANGDGDGIVAWCWKAGGAPTATNTSGTAGAPGQTPTSGSVMIDGVASTAQLPTAGIYPRKMSVNTEAGFSIVQWSGNEANNTVPHGLNSAPELIMFKSLLTGNWIVGSDYLDNTSGWNKQLYLNLSNAEAGPSSASFNNTAPTSDTFSVGASDATNDTGTDSMIAYCWHSVPGYSKIGSYTGNFTSDNYVELGFKPAFVMVKATNNARSWAIFDNARDPNNQTTQALRADMTNGDLTGSVLHVDFEATGFRLKGTDSLINNTYDYIYMAFADTSPNLGLDATTDGKGVTLLLDGSSLTDDLSDAENDLTAYTNTTVSGGGAVTLGTTDDINVDHPYGTTGVTYLDFQEDDGLAIPLTFDLSGGDWTFECWVRFNTISQFQSIFSSATTGIQLSIESDPSPDQLEFSLSGGSSLTHPTTISDATWYHVALTYVASSQTLALYVDGTGTSSSNSDWATVTGQYLGGSNHVVSNHVVVFGVNRSNGFPLDGQLTDVRFTKGIARDIAAEWAAGTYNSALTNDNTWSGKPQNNFAVNGNITPDDQLIDSPNLRFATLDPATASASASVLSNANLTQNIGTTVGATLSDASFSAGKYYAEVRIDSMGNPANAWVGVSGNSNTAWDGGYYWGASAGVGTGRQYSASSNDTFGSNPAVGDIIQIAVDRDNGKIWWGLNGAWQQNGGTSPNPATGTDAAYTDASGPLGTQALRFGGQDGSGSDVNTELTWNFGQDHTFSGTLAPLSSPYDDGDNGEFRYQPPSGFKALATSY